MPLSRRRFVETLLAVAYAAPRLFAARSDGDAAALPIDILRTKLGASPDRVLEQNYRADATILLFSFPLYTRSDVGGAVALFEERKQDDDSILSLEFAAGSVPERARGLNRLGYFQEIVVRNAERVEQAAYFGFMTSSPEETAAAAKRVLDKAKAESTVYDAISGHIGEGREQSRRSHLDITSTLEWNQFRQLADQVEQGLRISDSAKEQQQAGGPEVGTFLHAVMSSAWSRREKRESVYSYSGKKYRLQTERTHDSKMAKRLIEGGVIAANDKLMRLEGKIRNLQTNNNSKFKLWISNSEQQLLPVRFEYKARSFLRIEFEAVPPHGRLAAD